MVGWLNILLGGLFILCGLMGLFILQMVWSGLLFSVSGVLLAAVGVLHFRDAREP